LLDVSRVSSGKLVLKRERVTVQTVVHSAIEASRPLVEAARHELTVQLPEQPLYLDADLTRLAQVISNLLNNAAKYTPDGGRIELDVRQEADRVVIRVTDTGAGIPAEMLPRVFELFTQVGQTINRSQGGLGIGLALVKRLVEMHGGTIDAQSPGPGAGSTFTVRLPLASEDKRDAPAVSEPGTARQAGRRILVVDDNEDAAESLAMMLELDGHDARTAYRGSEALATARAFWPEVVFLDIGLPGVNGYEVARQFRQDPRLAGTILVALTGWGSEEDKRKSKEAGFDFHLTKPLEATAMNEVLARFSAIAKGEVRERTGG
jgi:CheY-like chemotaxis protein/two-component sensor histidine kinase